MNANALMQQVYTAFSPKPLTADEQDLFVSLDSVRGGANPIHAIAQKIKLSKGDYTAQVLTGHRGSGKSTELGQLKKELESAASGSKYFVVQVLADDALDRNDIDFPEVLIALIQRLAQDIKSRLDVNLSPGYFKSRFTWLRETALSEVELDKLSVSLPLAESMFSLQATLKSSPEIRKRVRSALNPDTNNWLTAANDVIGAATAEIIKQGYAGLVVIMDDLDKMISREHEAAQKLTTEYLFIDRASQLKAFKCHMVYTLPIELAYSHHQSTIMNLYHGLPIIPMTKINYPPTDPTQPNADFEDGFAKFRELINKRLTSIGVSEAQVFASASIRDQLIRLTGGQPTELMTFIREALISNGLPIGEAGFKRCQVEMRRSYARQMREEYWPLINSARKTGKVNRNDSNAKAYRELLDSRALLLYINDEEWLGVNPALNGIEPSLPLG